MEKKRNEILDLSKRLNLDNGVIVLTDMFGGTQSNLALSVMDTMNIEVIAR